MVLQISVLFGGVVSLLLLLISCGCFPFLTFIKLTVHVLRRILRRREKTEAPIEKRMTALITGAASGFGLEIAKVALTSTSSHSFDSCLLVMDMI